MKRLLIILLCLPLIFACTKEEPFVEGEEIVLDMSVNTDDVNAFATRAMGDKVDGTPALWLVVFNSEGMLVEWAKAYGFGDDEHAHVVAAFTILGVTAGVFLGMAFLYLRKLFFKEDASRNHTAHQHARVIEGVKHRGVGHQIDQSNQQSLG